MRMREAAVEAARRAVPADSHDVVRVHPRRGAAGDRQRRRRGEPALDRHRRVRRDALRHDDRHLLHPALLRGDPRAGRAVDASGAGAACGRAGRRRAHEPRRLDTGRADAPRRLRRRSLLPGAGGGARGRGGGRSRPGPIRCGAFYDSLAARRFALASRTPRDAAGRIQPTSPGSTSCRTRHWSAWFRPRSTRTGTCRPRSRGSASSAPRSASRARALPRAVGQRGGQHQPGGASAAFEPVAFDALRVTADVAWELDFWGRIRRGVQAVARRPRGARRRASAPRC